MSYLFRMSFCGFQFPEGALKYEIDPELTFQMAIEDYRRQGYSDKWINERMRSIEMRKIMHFELHFILGNRKNYCITSQWPVLAEPIHWIRFWSLNTNKSRCIVLRLSCNCSDSNLVFTATLLLIVLYITNCLSVSCSATFTATFSPKFGCTFHSSLGWICKSQLCIKHKWRFSLVDGALRLLFSDKYL